MAEDVQVLREEKLDGAFEHRLAVRYSDLSDTLQSAADFLVANPVDIATRPLRTVSKGSGVSSSAYTRLAKALDYDSFDAIREEIRGKIGQRVNNFADRAEKLQQDHGSENGSFVNAHLTACHTNLTQLVEDIDLEKLNNAVGLLYKARNVYLIGALGSTGVVEYLSYMAGFCSDNWMMLSRMGASLGSSLANLNTRDVVVVVTKPPFAPRVIKAAEIAKARGSQVMVISDTHACPALKYADISLIVPTESPHFFSSYVPTMFLAETLMSMFVSKAGPAAQNRIREVEENNRQLSEVQDG